jgi:hypothetical protein
MSLYAAMKSGIEEINRDNRRDFFKPNETQLLFDLERLSSNAALSGIIVVPAKTPVGYEVVTYTPPDGFEESVSSIGEDLWECAKEHYGLTGVVALLGAGGVPIKKVALGHPVLWNSSEYTNLISDLGAKYFRGKRLIPGPT